jgi:hypothetical protein
MAVRDVNTAESGNIVLYATSEPADGSLHANAASDGLTDYTARLLESGKGRAVTVMAAAPRIPVTKRRRP